MTLNQNIRADWHRNAELRINLILAHTQRIGSIMSDLNIIQFRIQRKLLLSQYVVVMSPVNCYKSNVYI